MANQTFKIDLANNETRSCLFQNQDQKLNSVELEWFPERCSKALDLIQTQSSSTVPQRSALILLLLNKVLSAEKNETLMHTVKHSD